ncbi:hypothetical protein M378DRAFT_182610 [Amanita muscaria Koide BX008]|uniref:Uncharacterized protein n=1 Tax=Amanita muscaria (strain Koide BX008) TaxID=946122 RepID=A0A0C2SJY6_AMAMK|nr:hypothetical protein M378DRAFT_182610 [Amanita muscaria Koide BX008]
MDIERQRNSFPLVKHWFREHFKENDTSDFSQLPKKLRFLEDELGCTITQARLDEMRHNLHSSFQELKSLMPSLLSSGGWLRCDQELQRICYVYMRRRYPELTLCERNWKVHVFLSEWYANWGRDRKKVKEEDTADENKAPAVVSTTTLLSKRLNEADDVDKLVIKKVNKGKGRAVDKEAGRRRALINPLFVSFF